MSDPKKDRSYKKCIGKWKNIKKIFPGIKCQTEIMEDVIKKLSEALTQEKKLTNSIQKYQYAYNQLRQP